MEEKRCPVKSLLSVILETIWVMEAGFVAGPGAG